MKTTNERILQRLTEQLSKEILDTLPIHDEDIAKELAEKAVKKGLLSGKIEEETVIDLSRSGREEEEHDEFGSRA